MPDDISKPGPRVPRSAESTLTAAPGLRQPQLTARPGDRFGHYRILEEIGQGGCGAVFVAEQEQPVRRRVALKVIKLGMDTRQVIARFEAERQALAMMDHPNIAKVLDAGATDAGRPFFVMELVKGIRITEYCDQHNLSTADRLKLFIQVCQAVQHAHQKGIIHRDLKPSNILVTLHDGVAVPKVIDFGIAKATANQKLTDKTVYTALEQFLGTPAYMSPEQAEMTGLDIDTRSDIYSLGVLLYELLIGETPFNTEELLAQGVEAMRRTLREKDPARPSTRLSTMIVADLAVIALNRQSDAPKLIRSLRGDLDWIVMKCLEKDRTRRYETANGLVMDIERHLTNEPVVARPPSGIYQFQKFARRNRPFLAAAGIIALVLVSGIAVSTSQAVRARGAERVQRDLRRQAEQSEKKTAAEAEKSRQVAQFLQEMLRGVGPSIALGRDTTLLREVLDKTAQRLEKELQGQPEVEAELGYTLGQVYFDLGQFEKAEAIQRKVLAILKRIHGDDYPDVLTTQDNLGNTLLIRGNLAGAEEMFRQTLAQRKNTPAKDDAGLADSIDNLALALLEKGKSIEAEALQREALALRQKIYGPSHEGVAASLNNLALTLHYEGKDAEAESMHRQALAMRRSLFGTEHPDIALSLAHLAGLLCDLGRLGEAEPLDREALQMRRKLLGNEHTDVAESLNALARILQNLGNYEEAETLQREALEMQRRLLGPETFHVSTSLNNLSITLMSLEKYEEAEQISREALALKKKLLGDERPMVADVLNDLALILRKKGDLAAAEGTNRIALAIRSKLLGDEHPDTVTSRENLALVLCDENRPVEAEPLLRQCLVIRETKRPNDWRTFKVRGALGRSLLGQKKYTDAEPLLASAYDGLKERKTRSPFTIGGCITETARQLAQLYAETGQPDKAAGWTARSSE